MTPDSAESLFSGYEKEIKVFLEQRPEPGRKTLILPNRRTSRALHTQ
jgi:hypothetical protein